MPSMNDDEATDELDIVDETPSYLLALASTGWGIWERDAAVETPVALFGADDDGFDQASDYFAQLKMRERLRTSPWLNVLRWTALIAAAAWVATSAYQAFLFTQDSFGSEGQFAVEWALAIERIANAVFFASAGGYVILWLRRRDAQLSQ
jgi:hypothetical protein